MYLKVITSKMFLNILFINKNLIRKYHRKAFRHVDINLFIMYDFSNISWRD